MLENPMTMGNPILGKHHVDVVGYTGNWDSMGFLQQQFHGILMDFNHQQLGYGIEWHSMGFSGIFFCILNLSNHQQMGLNHNWEF